MLAGLVVIFAGGVLWLAMLVGPRAALVTGFYPFVVADLLKLLIAAGVMPGMWRLLR
jgi:biotin transporter BioY